MGWLKFSSAYGSQRGIGRRSGRLKAYRLRQIATKKENQMEKIMEHEMYTGGLCKSYIAYLELSGNEDLQRALKPLQCWKLFRDQYEV